MVRFRRLVSSREARQLIAIELRLARRNMHQRRQHWTIRSTLLAAKSEVHFNYVHHDIAYRQGRGEAAACKARWAWMAEDALSRAYAQLVPGSIPLPHGFTFILDSD